MLRIVFLFALASAEESSCLLQAKTEKPELKTLKNHTEHVVLKPMVVKPAMVQEQEPVGLELTEEGAQCPNGQLEYTFTPNYGWSMGALSIGTVAPGVVLTLVSVEDDTAAGSCVVTEGQGAAISDQNLLIYESAGAPGVPCTPSSGRASITLTFDVPQTVVGFAAEIGGGRTSTRVLLTLSSATTLEYDLANEVQVQDRIVTLDPPQRLVKIFRIEFGGPVGLRSLTLCKFSGSLVGDPHIKTLDGGHYTLLQQGTFSAWHFKGLETSYETEHGKKSAPVDWQILAHYSGHLSFTRGLLLLDTSGSKYQAAEITAKECVFQTRKGTGDWVPMKKGGSLKLGDSGAVLTGLDIILLETENRTRRYDVQLSMNTLQGVQTMATLRVRCIPGHHINSKISMERPFDLSYVEGQMGTIKKGQGKKVSNLQMDNLEYKSAEEWSTLGGSSMAAAYLKAEDEEPKASLLQACSAAEKAKAAEMCSRHLNTHEGPDFQDCVFDVCAGGGEEAAVLAAEIQRA